MKYISIIWGIILVSILTLLTIFGFKYQEVSEYKKIEKEMLDVAKQYIKTNDIDTNNKEVIIKLRDLILFEPELEDYIIDNCSGKVVLEKKFIFKKNRAFIQCDNYKTK